MRILHPRWCTVLYVPTDLVRILHPCWFGTVGVLYCTCIDYILIGSLYSVHYVPTDLGRIMNTDELFMYPCWSGTVGTVSVLYSVQVYTMYPLTWWEICILTDLELLELLVYILYSVQVYTMYPLTWWEFCVFADLELLVYCTVYCTCVHYVLTDLGRILHPYWSGTPPWTVSRSSGATRPSAGAAPGSSRSKIRGVQLK